MVNVFCPVPDLRKAPTYLDTQRLGNQLWREAKTLVNGGWPNHPAAHIWRGHYGALAIYVLAGYQELERRRLYYRHHYLFWYKVFVYATEAECEPPRILNDPRFCAGHRSVLLARNPKWYKQFGWTEIPEPDTKKAYIWR